MPDLVPSEHEYVSIGYLDRLCARLRESRGSRYPMRNGIDLASELVAVGMARWPNNTSVRVKTLEFLGNAPRTGADLEALLKELDAAKRLRSTDEDDGRRNFEALCAPYQDQRHPGDWFVKAKAKGRGEEVIIIKLVGDNVNFVTPGVVFSVG